MQFIYVGRLDQEKGIDALLYCIKALQNETGIHFCIYGKGEYTRDIQHLSHQLPKLLSYHGWQDKKVISKQWCKCDFFIMPSNFLETFGLTACESLLLGVPVIGNKKGGLIPFIDDTLDIQQQNGNDDGEKLLNLIKTLLYTTHNQSHQRLIQKVQKEYTTEHWYAQYNQKKPIPKNILIASDFINYNGGGVETHIHDSMNILIQKKHQCTIYGHQSPTHYLSRLQKFWNMGWSIANIYDSIMISKIIKKNNIGLIRRHSISRTIGRLPLLIVGYANKNTLQYITHHELGLFHPYPSKVTNIQQLPDARSLSSFIKAGQTNSFLKKVTIIGKFILIRLIHKQLQKHINTHIVPSQWMVAVVKRRHPNANILCLPHFVSIQSEQ